MNTVKTTNIMDEYFLQPGYIYAGNEKIILKTVLGSCISICLWDNKKHIGGMNHYINPRKKNSLSVARYGDVAIPYLIKLMLKLGCNKKDLIAHVVGGSTNPKYSSSIGSENIKIANALLNKYKITILSRDVGGTEGKKVQFNTYTGEVVVNKCSKIRKNDWYK